MVSLTEEVAFIEDYIALQKLRLGEDYPIQFEKEGAFKDVQILPLSLIVLVENAFKYGVSQKNKTPILFQLKLEEPHISFVTENFLKENESESSHKIGLQNLRSRLELAYHKKFDLKTEVIKNKYIVILKLK